VLLVPDNWAGNVSEVSDKLATGPAIPVPLKLTPCPTSYPLLLLSTTINVPVSGPVVVGEKVTLIVQVAPTARLLPQLVVSPKLKA
jgi:hypothetical protein